MISNTELKNYIAAAHGNAKDKGFWEVPKTPEQHSILCIKELMEAAEADRIGKFASLEDVAICQNLLAKKSPDFEAIFKSRLKDTFEDELADAIIYTCDFAGAFLEKHKISKISIKPATYIFEHDNINTALHDLLVSYAQNWDFSKNQAAEIKFVENMLCTAEALFMHFSPLWQNDTNVTLQDFINLKMAYNSTRPRKHGKQY